MAAKIETPSGEKVTRSDIIHINPDDAVLGRNSRVDAESDPNWKQTVIDRAVSIAKFGQRTPCDAHRDGKNRIVIDAGQTRRAAVQLLRTGFNAVDPDDGETRFFHDPKCQLAVNLDTRKVTDKEAFIRSYIENVHREDLNPVQEAEAQAILRDEFGMSDAEIARLSGETNQNRVMALKKLMAAPDYVRDLVRDDKLGLYVYSENLHGLPPDQMKQAIDAATDDQGKVHGTKVREWLRNVLSGSPEKAVEKPEPDDEGEPTERAPKAKGPRVPKRTGKDLSKFIENYCSPDNEDRNDAAVKLLVTIRRWMDLELKTDKQLVAALDEIR